MPAVGDDVAPRVERCAHAADHVPREGDRTDKLLARHAAEVVGDGEGCRYGYDAGVHDGVLVHVVEVEAVACRRVALRGERQRQLLPAAPDGRLLRAAEALVELAHLLGAGLCRACDGDADVVEYLLFDLGDDVLRQVLVFRLKEQLCEYVARVHAVYVHDLLLSGRCGKLKVIV